MTEKFETIQVEAEDGIGTITLSRPSSLNAFTDQMYYELARALDWVDANDDVRAVIITGDGRAFSAGAELSSETTPFERTAVPVVYGADGVPRDRGGVLTLRLIDCKKPLIAAVNGAAVGVGATMTLAMDFRLASENARFGFVFTRRGIVPEACSSWLLPRLVGMSQAAEWIYTGRLFGATEALEGRLVRSVHPSDDLLPSARALAAEIAKSTSPISVTLSRQLLWRNSMTLHPMDAHIAESRGIHFTRRSADCAEGVSAFLEKRDPVFPGRVSQDLPDLFPNWQEPEYK